VRDFAVATTKKGAVVHTDGLQSYRVPTEHGYRHRRAQTTAAPGVQFLTRTDRAISNLKAWIHGTHSGVSDEHLPSTVRECIFRHNRRGTPMAAIQTVLGLGATYPPHPPPRGQVPGSLSSRRNQPDNASTD
jgi:hypothetical protein